MSTMVEQVARAVEAAWIDDGGKIPDFQSVARAAIAAMREPTEAMIKARQQWLQKPESMWELMIDAALEDK